FVCSSENPPLQKWAPETQPSHVYSDLLKINNHASHHQHDDQNRNYEIDTPRALGFSLLILPLAIRGELIHHRAIDIGRTLRALRLAGACVLRHNFYSPAWIAPRVGKGVRSLGRDVSSTCVKPV